MKGKKNVQSFNPQAWLTPVICKESSPRVAGSAFDPPWVSTFSRFMSVKWAAHAIVA